MDNNRQVELTGGLGGGRLWSRDRHCGIEKYIYSCTKYRPVALYYLFLFLSKFFNAAHFFLGLRAAQAMLYCHQQSLVTFWGRNM